MMADEELGEDSESLKALRRIGLYREQQDKIKRLLKWVADLQSGMYVNCVYCGHRYGPGETTPASMAEALKAHIEECPDHPMSALKRADITQRDLLQGCLEILRHENIEGCAGCDYGAGSGGRDRNGAPCTQCTPTRELAESIENHLLASTGGSTS